MKLAAVAVLFASVPAFADAPIKLRLTLKSSADTRTYDLLLAEKTCGKSEEKSAAHSDTIKVCAHDADHNNITLGVDWESRHQGGENTGSTTIIVARGATATVSSSSGFKLDLAVQ